MMFINNPNLPEKSVSMVIVDTRISDEAKN